MLSIGRSLRCAIFLCLFIANMGYSDETRLQAEAFVRLPLGSSVWRVMVDPPERIKSLSLSFTRSPSCPPLAARIQYYNPEAGQWVQAPFSDGFFLTQGHMLQYIDVVMTQRSSESAECQIRIFKTLPSGRGDEQPSGTAVFAGMYDYKGGFQDAARLVLNKAYYADSIEINMPSFCQNVDLLEVGVLSANQRYPAQRVTSRGNTWKLSRSAMAFNEVYLSLNGPLNQACQIPVYVQDLEPRR